MHAVWQMNAAYMARWFLCCAWCGGSVYLFIAGGLISAGKVSPTRAMFAWSSQQHYKQQLKRQQPAQLQGQLEGQQQEHGSDAVPWPPVLRTGAVVMALQGPVEMELLIAQVRSATKWAICLCASGLRSWVLLLAVCLMDTIMQPQPACSVRHSAPGHLIGCAVGSSTAMFVIACCRLCRVAGRCLTISTP